METALEAFRNGCLFKCSIISPSSSKIYLKRLLDRKHYFSVENIKLLPKGNWLTMLQLEQYVFCITITYLRSLAFKVDELNFLRTEPKHIPLERSGTVGTLNGTQK